MRITLEKKEKKKVGCREIAHTQELAQVQVCVVVCDLYTQGRDVVGAQTTYIFLYKLFKCCFVSVVFCTFL